MAELVPIPLPLLLRRAFLELRGQGAIFDLPQTKFFRGLPGLDLSVIHQGRRAATPFGPAAGPHGQLAQNIALCWLGGARMIELKTVQILDELKVPRPCIDVANVGYNVEWSQELKLEQSLREYVSAMMLIEIFKASHLLGDDLPASWGDTIYDMSVGYNLEGIRSARVTQWIESMKDATAIIDELREQLTGEWAQYRDLPFPSCISDSITLSTFHGCPANEIESIVTHLLSEMGLNVCVKMNPTLLGRESIQHLLHDVLGYKEIQLHPPAFESDLKLDEAVDLIPRLESAARLSGRTLSLKFSNTLVVKNHKSVFTDELMYLSGPPLHVITMNLVKQFRERMGRPIPTSFAAGLTAQNIASAVAMNFVPVTACTDLLRAGGYARILPYLEQLGARMNELSTTRLPDFILRSCGQGRAAIEQVAPPEKRQRLLDWLDTPAIPLHVVCDSELEQKLVDAAGMLNTPQLVGQATRNSRYSWERNKGVPRKIGSHLWVYDCINCDKCVPGCPNDANFTYETHPAEFSYDNLELSAEGIRHIPGGMFHVTSAHQLANYADACNECGNCAILCPEDGGPYIAKPRFFSSLETYRRDAGNNGFHLAFEAQRKTIHGTIGSGSYRLTLDHATDRAWFGNGAVEIEFRLATNQALAWTGTPSAAVVDMLPFYQLRMLVESISDPRHIHFANVAGMDPELTGVH